MHPFGDLPLSHTNTNTHKINVSLVKLIRYFFELYIYYILPIIMYDIQGRASCLSELQETYSGNLKINVEILILPCNKYCDLIGDIKYRSLEKLVIQLRTPYNILCI